MAIFDYTRAAAILNTSPFPVTDAIQTQFGVPNCLMDMSKDALKLLPSSTNGGIKKDIVVGRDAANATFNNRKNALQLESGIVAYDTSLGRYVFVSESSTKGEEDDQAGVLGSLGAAGAALGESAASITAGTNVGGQTSKMLGCLQQATSWASLQKGASTLADKMSGFTSDDGTTFNPPPAAKAASEEYDASKGALERTSAFIAKADQQIQNINEILQARQEDPENNPEPCFWGNLDIGDGLTLEQSIVSAYPGSGMKFCNAVSGPNGPIIVEDVDINPFTDVIYCHNREPPVSKKGQYLFSRTGIYYDSYGGGLEYEGCISNIVSAIYYDSEGVPRPEVGVPPKMMKWMEEYNPNIGGKGEIITWATFNKWAGTVFDIDAINESPEIQAYYNDDHFLQVLIDQRNRQVYDVSSYVGDLQASGFSEDSALLSNQRQVLYSMISDHDYKIKRRKKQIEVHVVLAPQDKPAIMGQIPINDFQGLDAAKLAIEKGKQEQLLFNPGECSGIVLPLCPTFIKSEIPQDTFTADEIYIAPVGVGSIINSDPDFYGVSGTVLSLDSRITTDHLVSVYNFLDADIVPPDSDKYFVINCNTSSASDKPAQIVASSIDSMFPSGIGLPYFRGVCNMFSGVSGDGNTKAPHVDATNEELYSAYRPYGYAKLQQGWDEVDSLLYSNTGATFEFWTHIPDLGDATGPGWNADNSLSSLHRVVMGNENRGGTNTSPDEEWIIGPQYGSDVVRGMIMGFSRDRRIAQGAAPSNNPSDNLITDGLVFHMSPTQSVNTSGVTFLSASANSAWCVDDKQAPDGYYGITVDTSSSTSTGDKLNDCSSGFKLVTITVDYGLDLVSIYLNGNLLKSQSVEATFGGEGPPRIPSITDLKSFNYDIQYTSNKYPSTDVQTNYELNAPAFPPNSLGQTDFWYWDGPKSEGGGMGVTITPWVIGGGYTDGMHTRGMPFHIKGSNEGMNFMGGRWGGKKSGLNGFLGSLKLYNKAISSNQVLTNYQAQQGFFESIRI